MRVRDRSPIFQSSHEVKQVSIRCRVRKELANWRWVSAPDENGCNGCERPKLRQTAALHAHVMTTCRSSYSSYLACGTMRWVRIGVLVTRRLSGPSLTYWKTRTRRGWKIKEFSRWFKLSRKIKTGTELKRWDTAIGWWACSCKYESVWCIWLGVEAVFGPILEQELLWGQVGTSDKVLCRRQQSIAIFQQTLGNVRAVASWHIL